MRRRTGPVLLAVLSMVTGATAARAHQVGAPGSGIPDPVGRIHSCYLGSPPILPSTLRAVTETEICLVSLPPIPPVPPISLPIENSVDWPASGVLTHLVEGPPASLPLTLPTGAGQTGDINLNCPPGKVALGLAEFSAVSPSAPARVIETRRSGTPPGSTLTVTFSNILMAAATISNLSALCVTLFTQ